MLVKRPYYFLLFQPVKPFRKQYIRIVLNAPSYIFAISYSFPVCAFIISFFYLKFKNITVLSFQNLGTAKQGHRPFPPMSLPFQIIMHTSPPLLSLTIFCMVSCNFTWLSSSIIVILLRIPSSTSSPMDFPKIFVCQIPSSCSREVLM